MEHKISITTVEALLLNKALRMDMQNDVDNEMAKRLIDKITATVEKDIRKSKPTDLTNKCGSCRWAIPRHHHKEIDCICPDKNPNWFARTRVKCKFYEEKQ